MLRTLPAALTLQVALDETTVVEGSVLRTTVRALAPADVKVEGGEVALVRTVTYRYSEGNIYGGLYAAAAPDGEVVATAAIPVVAYGGLYAAAARDGEVVATAAIPVVARLVGATRPFEHVVELPVPGHGPGSADGQLVTVAWSVRATLWLRGAGTVVARAPVTVLSRAADRAVVALQPPVRDDRGFARVALDLATRRLVPGVSIAGTVTVTALRPGAVRGVRLDLVLLEHVAHGPWTQPDPRNPHAGSKDAETVATVLPLIGPVELDPAAPLRLPFTLAVPARLPAPSLQTPQFELRWVLRAVVDRALHADPYTEVELRGSTAATGG